MTQEELKELFNQGEPVEEREETQEDLKSLFESAEQEPEVETQKAETLAGVDLGVEVPEAWTQPTEEEVITEPLHQEVKPELNIGRTTVSTVLGAKRLPLGVAMIMQDLYNASPDLLKEEGEASDYATWASNAIKENEALIAKINTELGYKEGELSPDDFGQVFGELATLPLATLKGIKGLQWLSKTKTAATTKAAIAEAPVAGISTLGEGGTYGEAGTSAAMSALATKIGGEAIHGLGKIWDDPSLTWRNIISGKASDKQAYDFLIKKSGETTKSINEANQRYAQATGKNINELTEADKINALLNNTEAGAKFKMEAEYYNEYVLSAENKLEETLTEVFKRNTKTGSFDIPALKLQDLIDDTSRSYSEVKNVLIQNFNKKVSLPQKEFEALKEALEDAIGYEAEPAALKGILGDLMKNADGLDIETLMKMNRSINGANLKSSKGFAAGELKGFIDNLMKESIGSEHGYQLWKHTNKRYGQVMSLQGENPLGKLLRERINKGGILSADELAEEVIKMRGKGHGVFNEVNQLMGEDVSTQVEKKIIDTIIKDKGSLSGIVEDINKFEFASKAGQSLQREINRASGMISDTSIKDLMMKTFGGKAGGVGWSDNLVSKLKFTIVGKIWDNIGRRLPSGEAERALMTIGDMVKDRGSDFDLKMISGNKFEQLFKEEVARYAEDIKILKKIGKNRTRAENLELGKKKADLKRIEAMMKDMPKKLEYKPTDAFVSGRGTVSGSAEASARADEAARAFESRARGGESYDPTGQFQDIKVRGKKPIEVTIEPDDTAKGLPEPKGTRNIIDAEVIEKPKGSKMTEAKAKRTHEAQKNIKEVKDEVDRLNRELKSIDKSNISKSKKAERKKDIKSEIRKLNAKLITLNKKVPK